MIKEDSLPEDKSIKDQFDKKKAHVILKELDSISKKEFFNTYQKRMHPKITQKLDQRVDSQPKVEKSIGKLSNHKNHKSKRQFMSNKKIILKIQKVSIDTQTKERQYLVLCRYGTENSTFYRYIQQKQLKQKFPEILIEYLQARSSIRQVVK